jgi:hypothetical protein
MSFSNDYSVVIQGRVFGKPGDVSSEQLTMHCITSVRKHLPDCEIILSTWEGTDVSHLNFDKIVFSHDPGGVPFTDLHPNFLNNNNRQIVSTFNGLKAATKKYAIKMRGDCLLTSTDFKNYFKEYPRSSQFKFLKQRVVIPTLYSRNPRRIAMLFHPSDLFQVGLLEDLMDLWDIPLQPEPQMTRGVPAEKRIINHSLKGYFYRMKMGSEQYIWYACAKKHGLDLELKYYSQLPLKKIRDSEFSLINNFVVADSADIGVQLPARIADNHLDYDLYTHEEWLNLAQRYASTTTPKIDEMVLIAQVYANNWRNISSRGFNKVIRDSKKLGHKVLNYNKK